MNIALDIGYANNTGARGNGREEYAVVRHREGHQRGELRHILSVRSDSSDSPYGPRGSHLLLP